ncbi:MAG: tRNA (adenosine(37)-N6)-threonylcarbamoyltransferase complex transferase subunit TsaD [Chloroflexi bacterium]|nr:tRNA (adenosine(37)-N6)-threonylcarbamoyltransferase complex transferase subunit TsaD [Chloroflexota bacterium]
MHILGIETSCDETGVAIVKDGHTIVAHRVASQAELHSRYGGVFPEVAARQHVLTILPLIRDVLDEAGAQVQDMDAIAVTYGPGLVGSLLVGVNVAKGLAWAAQRPLIPVNHLEGHIYSNWVRPPDAGEDWQPPPFPTLVLIVSGGHTELVLMRDHGLYQRLGGTLDDAAGEAFDKVARVLGLGYPGGPAIQKAAERGDPHRFSFPSPRQPGFNFSFSGLKTAVLRQVQMLEREAGIRTDLKRRMVPVGASALDPQTIADLAAAFQKAVVDGLVQATRDAVEATGARHVCVCGGVAANALLRREMKAHMPVPVSIPPLFLCMDNGVMIASAGYYTWQRGIQAGWDLDVDASLMLPTQE